jgi:hypothetical protein
MEHLLRLIESYLKSRMAILRTLSDRKLTPTELEALTDVSYSNLFRRRKNAAHWRSSELKTIAGILGMSAAGIVAIETLAQQIDALPQPDRYGLLKQARLGDRHLKVRLQKADNWQYEELERLATILRRWKK